MKTALLVIDYINGIMKGSCKEFAKNHLILSATNKLIVGCRKAAIPIYFIRLAFDAQYSDIPKHSKSFNYVREHNLFKIGNADTEFVSDLDMMPNDIVINKTAASPFHSKLSELLKSQSVERLIFAGVATDNAISIGVREAHDDGYSNDHCRRCLWSLNGGASSMEYSDVKENG